MNQRGGLGPDLLGFSSKDKKIGFYTEFLGKFFSILYILLKDFKWRVM